MARKPLIAFMGIFRITVFLLWIFLTFRQVISGGHDYHDALRKSILFFEGQRSGKLPPDQRVKWRSDSALHDGSAVGVITLIPSEPPLHLTYIVALF